MLIKTRKAKKSERGVYVQDKELELSKFQPRTHYKYVIDINQKQLLIIPSENKKDNVVSKRLAKGKEKPVIDIRNKEALAAFSGSDFLQVEIFDDRVVVTGKKEEKVLSKAKSVIHAVRKFQCRRVPQMVISKKELEMAVGEHYLGREIVEEIQQEKNETSIVSFKTSFSDFKIPFQVASLFSGAGILDLGFLESGFDLVSALELDVHAVSTYRENLGEHMIHQDVVKFNLENQLYAPVVIGGPPCQGFSNANRRTNFLENPKNEMVKEFIKAVQNNPNTKVFVLENVPQILTAGDGKFKEEIYRSLSDFEITSGILNAADYGTPQERRRAIFIGSKIGKIEFPKPTHTKENYTTVGEAFQGIHDGLPNQIDVTQSKADTLERMKYVPPGGNWRDVPSHLFPNQKEKHSDLYCRLDPNKPSPSLANVRKQVITHPWLDRIISVRETARLFDISDTFVFRGTKNAKEQQLANAVPVLLAKAIAQKIRQAIVHYNRTLVFSK